MSSILRLLLMLGMAQMSLPVPTPTGSETLVGRVVEYDASLSAHTSQGDMVIKAGDGEKYLRIRYAPNGFGFDAPPAKDIQLLPKQMVLDGSITWEFRVHPPLNPEEQAACTGVQRRYAPDGQGTVKEVERFKLVPGASMGSNGRPEKLPCVILDSWKRREGPGRSASIGLDPETGDIGTMRNAQLR